MLGCLGSGFVRFLKRFSNQIPHDAVSIDFANEFLGIVIEGRVVEERTQSSIPIIDLIKDVLEIAAHFLEPKIGQFLVEFFGGAGKVLGR